MPCMAGPSDDDDKSPARDIIASSGYSCCYGDASSNANQNIPDHLHGFGPPGAEIYTMIASGVENMIGFSPKNPQSGDDSTGAVPWKGSFFARGGPQHDLTELLKQSPLQPCVFPCEGSERRPSSHGLSLSLNPFNPSSIGVQSSFELRLQQQQQQQEEEENELFRFGPSSSRFVSGHNIQQPSLIRNSRFLGPAQELLREFCDLGWKHDGGQKMKSVQKDDGVGDELRESENPVKRQPLYSLDVLELQRRKSKLLHMLQEVERRYRNYREEMRAVTSSFEWVCGSGAATSYSILASKAMSRHFRCLKDGILNQIKATNAAMGEDTAAAAAAAAAGTAKGGETPRLRILDQTMRQQRAIQQMSNMEIHPWRPQRGLPERSVSVLRAWLFEHFLHPYPSDVDKHILARQTGLSRSQVSNWFINARVRLWKPMVEEMYLEELKEDNHHHHHHHGDANGGAPPDRNPPSFEEQKPDTGRVDPDSLSSIIDRRSKQPVQAQEFGRVGPSGDSFGFGFLPYGEASCQQDGVSLTLGLHQHGTGVGMPAGSLFYSREAGMEEECQTVQYSSLLEGESQNPPYRNLMGAQLLHDLAGAG